MHADVHGEREREREREREKWEEGGKVLRYGYEDIHRIVSVQIYFLILHKGSKNNDRLVAITHTASAQILVSKSHSLIIRTRASWKNSQF